MRKLPLKSTHVVSVVLGLALVVAARPSLASRSSLVANPTSVAFGNLPVGTTQSQYATLTNRSSGSVTLYKSSITGTGFSASGLALPMTLSAGQSTTFTLTFAPQSGGTSTGSFSLTTKYWRGNISISLSGTGTVSAGQLSVAPGNLNFGSVAVGSAASLSSSLSASGGNVTLTSVTTTNAQFYLNGLSLPVTLAAGQSMPFTVTFAPQSSGTTSGTFAFVSTSATAVNEALAGTGITPITHQVSLSWTDGDPSISGYNIYRSGTSSGPYSRINSSLNAGASFVDNSVSAGQTYYYVTTAVNASGVESPYSNQVQAVIPSP